VRLHDDAHARAVTVRAVTVDLRNGDAIIVFTYRENDKVFLTEAHSLPPF
jgi:hypothetical protein